MIIRSSLVFFLIGEAFEGYFALFLFLKLVLTGHFLLYVVRTSREFPFTWIYAFLWMNITDAIKVMVFREEKGL